MFLPCRVILIPSHPSTAIKIFMHTRGICSWRSRERERERERESELEREKRVEGGKGKGEGEGEENMSCPVFLLLGEHSAGFPAPRAEKR